MNKVAEILIYVIPLIVAVVFHEVAHGYVAYFFGDPTAKRMGRLTLNPIAHVDLFGTILLPLILYLSKSGFMFGYAKPVPVNPFNLRKLKPHMVLVSLAGPTTNFILAIIALIVIKIIYTIQPGIFSSNATNAAPFTFVLRPLALMLPIFLLTNLFLGAFNLIPIPPLDGGHILMGLVPDKITQTLSKIEPFGFFILIILMTTGGFDKFLWTIITLVLSIMGYVANLPLLNIIFTTMG